MFSFSAVKSDNSAGIDMVDSSNSAGYSMERPEEETVMALKNDKQRLPNANKSNAKQINTNGNGTFDKHRSNCDSVREINATNGNGRAAQCTEKINDDLFDDEDPYAELQSYLDKVKVSVYPFLLSFDL